ncbi:Glycosyl hydrolase, family 13, subfamily, catalytic region domain protein [Candidatus Magnetobacterium bavaricum]|uniref:Glycosyl hydrolase, family 13, subfamily, catalytic region domain protein n=1 Tax=Candidatus Magnetobacterium bavaricum TaxID=29290 RepID=A0A0F3GTI8_9BACT|nr:Glycosyl hydrolase, family 13, subfamily, catalytic region domain protein [Candidatus Magnetobacterium bavaricum]
MSSLKELLAGSVPKSLKEVDGIIEQARQSQYKEIYGWRAKGVNGVCRDRDWRDEVLYFLLPDRFSNEQTHDRSNMLTLDEIVRLRNLSERPGWDWGKWSESATRWQGGTIKGIRSKLKYLRDLGITALWIGPLFKQRAHQNTFHGYAIQNFLDIDPRFGTREDLIELVEEFHANNIKVVLDVIFNHSGDNWGYEKDGKELDKPSYQPWPKYYGDPNDPELRKYSTKWRNSSDSLTNQMNGLDDGVWPIEFQDFSCYTRAGRGSYGEGDIRETRAQHKRIDFDTLKDFALDNGGTLGNLIKCYQYWIAITNCDGFRIDTLKHVSIEDARNFCNSIKMFAEGIGKCDFFLVGEVGGGEVNQQTYIDYLSVMKSNLNAALDIGEHKNTLAVISLGGSAASSYLNGFKCDTEDFGSHNYIAGRHVSVLDDHDQISKNKERKEVKRFSEIVEDNSPSKNHHIVVPIAIQLFTLGIPCIYYGSEQAIGGIAKSQIKHIPGDFGYGTGDKLLREAMFGPEHPRKSANESMSEQLNSLDTSLPGFGAYGTAGKHCFNTSSPAFVRIKEMLGLRFLYDVIRYGLQYQLLIRLPGNWFVIPNKGGELIVWSRLYAKYQQVICIANPHQFDNRGADVCVNVPSVKKSDNRGAGVASGTQINTIDMVIASGEQANAININAGSYKVILNTAEVGSNADVTYRYNGSHRTGSVVPVKDGSSEYPYIEIRDIQPGEVIILINS